VVLLTKREKMKSRVRQIFESNDASSPAGRRVSFDFFYRKGKQKSRKLEMCSSRIDDQATVELRQGSGSV